MGKNKDKKKKGKGMEKTLAKTEKKVEKRLKKELEEIGEDNIENLIAAFQQKDKELTQVKEELCNEPPSKRTGASFSADPERDEFILFGGEYYDGSKIYMYNDLYIYSIKKNQWSLLKAPNSPPPRSSHQAAYLARNQGELWVFGGEFASPTQSQFYHYNDLWVFRFATKQWEKVNAPNGPSPRSGHRMIIYKKYLLVFGGFHDNLRNCRYFNDTFIFNLETNQWQELKFSSVNELPSPRSACQLVLSAKNNAVIVYGGYSKEKLKKDREKGVVHTDMFALSQDTKKDGKVEWHWKKVKQTGARPSERCSFSMITLLDDSAILFGGVYDHDNNEDDDDDDDEEEENVKSTFYNDLYKLDLGTYKWKHINLKGKKPVKKTKSSKKTVDNNGEMVEQKSDESDEENDAMETDASKIDDENLEINKLNIKEESVFELTVNKDNKDNIEKLQIDTDTVVTTNNTETIPFSPIPRRNAYLQLHKGYLYLYGGCFEAKNGKEITLTDMYCLNLKKIDEWKTLIEDKDFKNNSLKQVEEESNDEDDDDEDDDSEMEIDAPEIEENETVENYYQRTKDVWLSEAKKEFPDEKSNKILNKMSKELCNMYFEAVNNNDNSNDETQKKDVASNF